jgi:sugar/nucleoside kinase (ribokinase family)
LTHSGRGATTSLDTQWDPRGAWAGLDAVLAATDILLPNEAEACARSRTPGWEQALIALAARVPTVAVKRGSAGAAAMRGAARAEASPPPVEVVDAIGADDSFDAGFVYGALAARPRPGAGDCVWRALNPRGRGTAAQATLEEALAWI